MVIVMLTVLFIIIMFIIMVLKWDMIIVTMWCDNENRISCGNDVYLKIKKNE